jgi:RNA polymerase subunit RPABC4/transcription elongation factor Spt4
MRKTRYNCPTCHRPIQFKQKMCPACETRIDWSGTFCPNCNYKVEESEDCPRCNTKIYWPKQTILTPQQINTPDNTIADYSREVQENMTFQKDTQPTLWQWYFCKHPRVLILVPVFLYFILGGVTSGITAITDMIYFFQIHTWGAVAVYLILGTVLIPIVLLPSIVAFYSIKWLYSTFFELKNPWAKLGLTIFLLFVLPWITTFERYLYLLILGISEKFGYTFLPYW